MKRERNWHMKHALKAGLSGAAMGLLVSFAVNYFVIPVPTTEMMWATGNGISGLMSGFMGGFMGLLMFLRARSAGASTEQ